METRLANPLIGIKNKMKITRKQLRQIIRETLDPDLLKGAYVSSREDREAFKDYIAKVKAKRMSMDDDPDSVDAALSQQPGIQIVYDGFQNQYDQTVYDFIINGKPVSTRAMNSTHPKDISYELSDLIGVELGTARATPDGLDHDWVSDEAELESEKIALNFLMSNKQFLRDVKLAQQYHNEYPGY